MYILYVVEEMKCDLVSDNISLFCVCIPHFILYFIPYFNYILRLVWYNAQRLVPNKRCWWLGGVTGEGAFINFVRFYLPSRS